MPRSQKERLRRAIARHRKKLAKLKAQVKKLQKVKKKSKQGYKFRILKLEKENNRLRNQMRSRLWITAMKPEEHSVRVLDL